MGRAWLVGGLTRKKPDDKHSMMKGLETQKSGLKLTNLSILYQLISIDSNKRLMSLQCKSCFSSGSSPKETENPGFKCKKSALVEIRCARMAVHKVDNNTFAS
jgi:hypothetical protein